MSSTHCHCTGGDGGPSDSAFALCTRPSPSKVFPGRAMRNINNSHGPRTWFSESMCVSQNTNPVFSRILRLAPFLLSTHPSIWSKPMPPSLAEGNRWKVSGIKACKASVA